MDLKTHRSALDLVRQMSDRKTSIVPRIATSPQKPPCCNDQPILKPLPRSVPEAQGISSSQVAGFLKALQDDETLDMHNILILRHGAVIAEASFGAYEQHYWHITHSECKSITGLAIGMLIDEGSLSLDDKLVKLFEMPSARLSKLTHRNITVRHLLAMSSGIVFNEAGAVTETDWVKCFLESAVLSEPGKQFNYNSMNTYMLSAIVRQVSGQGLMAYLQERLWEPLGITGIFWETCPKGIEKGGWGLYIRPEDLAKVGQLVLQKGRWEGRQLVSESWIDDAASVKMTSPEIMGDFDYGYQLWVGQTRRSFLFNGLFGQNVLGFPDQDLLILSNAGNNELFQRSHFFALVNEYFPEGSRLDAVLPENLQGFRQLEALQHELRHPDTLKNTRCRSVLVADGKPVGPDVLWAELSGKTFLADQDESAAVGLLPLFTQVIQNNYTKGLKSLGFEDCGGDFFLTVTESDEAYRLPVGFDAPKLADLSFHGEPYRVGVTGRFTTDENNTLVLAIRVSFLEIANSRHLKIYFHGDTIVTRWTETPGKTYIFDALDVIGNGAKTYRFIKSLLFRTDPDFTRFKISSVLEPEIVARLDRGAY